MSPYETAAAALLAAVEPVAAYCARTPPPNRHAEQLETLLDAVAAFGDEADVLAAAPPWEAITFRLFERFPYQGLPDPLIERVRRSLAIQANPRLCLHHEPLR